ncbi:glycosyltransferase family 2 protein [Chromobacterium aquaticum]|uniref:Glycosyltransferase family 2 protein n=1 Tax=Chromobacterium aquaticum TaxID=467180 RepID=A0ABV8ZMF7_9NEIS|nr:glycosyltransferase family 2 protein [Chromobacterium aquaticum]MCD5362338.1 glycosyltransferase family 2 protein [Chromobacterium aquaticum]
MLNVVIPMAGFSTLSNELEYPYPSPLVEIHGKPLIQHVIENLQSLDTQVAFTVILREDDCRRFHLDSTIQLLTDHQAKIIQLKQGTAGALCSVLLAVEGVATAEPVVIANADQIFDNKALLAFVTNVRETGPDAACPIFESVHPRWSYVRISDGYIVEAIEKNPISRHAVAGMYYFRSGQQFAELAMQAILNGRHTEEKFYTSAVLNEYILAGLSVLPVQLRTEDYHSLFTAQRVHDYEHRLRGDLH